MGAGLGALTPFCACSTIPMTLGFLEIGIPFSAVKSFVIASPLSNPIILAMLIALMGIKVAVVYFIIVFGAAIVFGILLASLVKNIRVKGGTHEKEEAPKAFKSKAKLAFSKAWRDFYGILGFLLIGVGIGAVIYGYLPEDIVLRYAGPDNPLAIPFAAIIGIPFL